MDKVNKVIKFEDLPDDAIKALEKQYPEGWKPYIRKISKSNGEFFHAIRVDTENICYLVKIDVKIDLDSELEKMVEDFMDRNAEKEAELDSKNEEQNEFESDTVKNESIREEESPDDE
jgi:hypothetical protein